MVAILKQKNRHRKYKKNIDYMLWFRFFLQLKRKVSNFRFESKRFN